MKRILCLLTATIILICALFGCNKMPAVDKNVKPAQHLSQYEKLTELYGTPWRDVLAKLDIDLQELNAEGLNHVGIPMQEHYAGLVFDTYLRFGGEDDHLRGTTISTVYRYPEEEVTFLRDIVTLSRELISDFGEPSDTSLVFNWVEKMMGEQWNRDIAYWQDIQVLKRLADNGYNGNLLLWDLTPVAGETVRKTVEKHALALTFSIQEQEGIAVLDITY